MKTLCCRAAALAVAGWTMIGLGCPATPRAPAAPAEIGPPASSAPEPAAGTAEATEPVVVPLLGCRLGAREADAFPPGAVETVLAADGSTPEMVRVDAGGTPLELRPSFVEGYLYSVTGTARQPGADEATFEAVRRRVEADLGPASLQRCASEDGVPFADYVRTGRGSLAASWDGETVSGAVSLQASYARDGAAQLSAHFTHQPLLRRIPFDDFGFDGVEGDLAPPDPEVGRGVKQAPEACTADLSGAPALELWGLRFGSAEAEAGAAVGVPPRAVSGWISEFPYRVAGVPGTLVLSFWSGCLAVVMFVVRDEAATEASYRALQGALRERFGAGDAVACRAEPGGPPAADGAERGALFDTLWAKDALRYGRLRFGPASSGPGSEIVLEVGYVPMEPYAPHYDFDAP